MVDASDVRTIGDAIKMIKSIKSDIPRADPKVYRKNAKQACDEASIVNECIKISHYGEIDIKDCLEILMKENLIVKREMTGGKVVYLVKNQINEKV